MVVNDDSDECFLLNLLTDDDTDGFCFRRGKCRRSAKRQAVKAHANACVAPPRTEQRFALHWPPTVEAEAAEAAETAAAAVFCAPSAPFIAMPLPIEPSSYWASQPGRQTDGWTDGTGGQTTSSLSGWLAWSARLAWQTSGLYNFATAAAAAAAGHAPRSLP